MKYIRINIEKVVQAVVLVMIATSCSDFGDTNINPNASTTPVTAALLTSALTDVASSIGAYQSESTLFVQYLSQSQYPEASLYSTTSASWSDYYLGPLENLQTIIQYNTDETTKATMAQYGSNNNQIAVARILKVYYYRLVTDQWGDIPYSQALVKNLQPVYDTQESIYTDFFKELKEASAQFDDGKAVQGDILFGGDASRWKMFANSLRMLIALRLSKVAPETAQTEFVAAYNDAAGHIRTNADNAVYVFLNDNNFRNPWSANFDGRDDYGVSNVLIDQLKALDDPRISGFAAETSDGEYIGLPYGLTRDSLINWTAASDYSRPSAKMLAKTFPGYVITASQMLLAEAEAVANNWISGDASSLYNDAIKASFEQWEVYSDATYQAYISNTEISIASSATDETLERIGTQRWLALFPNGLEAWAEWRRTEYPALVPTPYAVSESKQIPVRYGYPNSENNLNKTNYDAAVARIGGDTHDIKVWWDK
jgi:hypothetical protein